MCHRLRIRNECHFGTLMVAVLLALPIGQKDSDGGRSPTVLHSSHAALRLTVWVNKQAYMAGENVGIVYVLENVGEQRLYLDPRIPDPNFGSALSGFDIEIFDQAGTRVPAKSYEGLFTGFDPNLDVVRWIEKEWVALPPGYLYGKRAEMGLGSGRLLKPGRYKLIATYYNDTSSWMSTDQQERLWRLGISIWSGKVSSEPVWIEIVTQ